MSFEVDIPTTEEVLAAVFSSSLPALPPQEQRLGSSTVSWWETGPGEAYVHAEGGTGDDRHYARSLVAAELEAHGYAPAQFDLDVIHPESRRTASWVDPAIISHMDSVPMYHVAPPRVSVSILRGIMGYGRGNPPN